MLPEPGFVTGAVCCTIPGMSAQKRILVVDDSSTVRHILSAALVAEGYHVTEAGTGSAALEIARTQSFDLIVSDLNMPGLNGIELVTELRKLPQYEATPIFMLTTESNDDITAQGERAGVTAWMTKPFKAGPFVKGVQLYLSAD